MRRLHHGAVLLDGLGRLGPQRVGAAVGGERGAIEVGQQPQRASSPTSRSHSLLRDRPEFGRALRDRRPRACGSSSFSGRLPGLPVSTLRRVGLGRAAAHRQALRRADAASAGAGDVALALGRDRVERLAVGEQRRLLAGEGLPAPDRDIDVERIDLDREADPADGLRRDQGGAAAEERLVDRVCPGSLLLSIGRRMHSTGFWVPWTVSASWPPLGMVQSVVCLRSPVQLPFLRTAYQQGSCCQ